MNFTIAHNLIPYRVYFELKIKKDVETDFYVFFM